MFSEDINNIIHITIQYYTIIIILFISYNYSNNVLEVNDILSNNDFVHERTSIIIMYVCVCVYATLNSKVLSTAFL